MSVVEILNVGELSDLQLADVANREHALAKDSFSSSLEHAYLAGEALLAAKQRVGHGAWQPWLETNFEASQRTARAYMRVAKRQTSAILDESSSIDGALKALQSGDKQDKRKAREDKLRAERDAATVSARLSDRRIDLAVADVHKWRPRGVDAIVTDPPYITADAVDLYSALADFAVDVLPDGGALAAMCWQPILDKVIIAMQRPELVFRWLICWEFDSGEDNARTFDMARRIHDGWKPVLVYHKGGWADNAPSIYDIIRSPGRVLSTDGHGGDLHVWEQGIEGLEKLVDYTTTAGQCVCDPFMGSGTTGVAALKNDRDFVGGDIDPSHVAAVKARLL